MAEEKKVEIVSTRVYRYSWSLQGRPNLEVFVPELEEEDIGEVEQLFQMILGVQRRRHMHIPSAEEVYGILSQPDPTPEEKERAQQMAKRMNALPAGGRK